MSSKRATLAFDSPPLIRLLRAGGVCRIDTSFSTRRAEPLALAAASAVPPSEFDPLPPRSPSSHRTDFDLFAAHANLILLIPRHGLVCRKSPPLDSRSWQIRDCDVTSLIDYQVPTAKRTVGSVGVSCVLDQSTHWIFARWLQVAADLRKPLLRSRLIPSRVAVPLPKSFDVRAVDHLFRFQIEHHIEDRRPAFIRQTEVGANGGRTRKPVFLKGAQ